MSQGPRERNSGPRNGIRLRSLAVAALLACAAAALGGCTVQVRREAVKLGCSFEVPSDFVQFHISPRRGAWGNDRQCVEINTFDTGRLDLDVWKRYMTVEPRRQNRELPRPITVDGRPGVLAPDARQILINGPDQCFLVAFRGMSESFVDDFVGSFRATGRPPPPPPEEVVEGEFGWPLEDDGVRRERQPLEVDLALEEARPPFRVVHRILGPFVSGSCAPRPRGIGLRTKIDEQARALVGARCIVRPPGAARHPQAPPVHTLAMTISGSAETTERYLPTDVTRTVDARMTVGLRLLDPAGSLVASASATATYGSNVSWIGDSPAKKMLTEATDTSLTRLLERPEVRAIIARRQAEIDAPRLERERREAEAQASRAEEARLAREREAASARAKAETEAARREAERARAQPAAGPGPGRTFALVVGVNEYADASFPTLRCAENDARAFYGFLTTHRRSPADPDRVMILTGAEATHGAVLRAIREHLEQKASRAEDTAILYFAGHGLADAQETYLATRDTTRGSLPETSVPLSTLRTYWGRIAAGTKVLITDACHSGGLAGLRGIGGVQLAPATSDPSGSTAGSATITLSASGVNELSAEDERAGQGVFTGALLNGLRGDADANGDGRVAAAELRAYLTREVPAAAKRVGGHQNPVVAIPAGAEGRLLTR